MKQLPPSFILCPIFDDVNKWNFFYPPPSQIGKCLILGNFFFLKASLIASMTPICFSIVCYLILEIIIINRQAIRI